jgi:predicted O-methyltransferase YrrM
MDLTLFSKVDHYVSDLFAPEDKGLINTLDSLKKEELGNQSISANQGKFLQVLMSACDARRVLELGTFVGYSAIWIARALPDNGKLITIEADLRHAKIAQQNIDNSGLSGKVEIKTGKALDILQAMVDKKTEPFDFIFIDADKPPYAEYFELALKLSRKGTIMVFDNVVREGKILDPNSTDEAVKGVQRLNKLVSTHKRVTAIILPSLGVKNYDGMLVGVVK